MHRRHFGWEFAWDWRNFLDWVTPVINGDSDEVSWGVLTTASQRIDGCQR